MQYTIGHITPGSAFRLGLLLGIVLTVMCAVIILVFALPEINGYDYYGTKTGIDSLVHSLVIELLLGGAASIFVGTAFSLVAIYYNYFAAVNGAGLRVTLDEVEPSHFSLEDDPDSPEDDSEDASEVIS